jgi:uncharacterized DUF497 family protein
MLIKGFEWDEVNVSHIELRHGVTPEEVEEVFVEKYALLKAKYGRYNALGYTFSGRLLSIIFEHRREGIIRVITARDMTRREIRYFKRRSGR